MRLTLCLPGLLLPAQALLDSAGDLPLPALANLLGRGRLHPAAASHYDWLAQAVGLSSLPAGALRVLGDEGVAPGTGHWLCLDPVHLKVHRSGVALAEPAALALDAEEDAALRALVAPLFTDLGELSGVVPGRWHLRLARPAALETRALPQAAGSDLDPHQPGGADAADWRRRLADAQTALHEHSVNRRREESGRAAVNSLWPWGAGALPETLPAAWSSVATSEPVIAGLARHLGADLTAPPGRFADAAAELVVLDDLAAPALRLDALAWRDALARLERDWFAPLADALRAGRFSEVRIAGFGGHSDESGLELALTRADLWKFWRRPRPLAEWSA